MDVVDIFVLFQCCLSVSCWPTDQHYYSLYYHLTGLILAGFYFATVGWSEVSHSTSVVSVLRERIPLAHVSSLKTFVERGSCTCSSRRPLSVSASRLFSFHQLCQPWKVDRFKTKLRNWSADHGWMDSSGNVAPIKFKQPSHMYLKLPRWKWSLRTKFLLFQSDVCIFDNAFRGMIALCNKGLQEGN